MKLALGMIVHNEAPWLRLHLPIFAHCFDGIIAVIEPACNAETRHCLATLRFTYPELYVYEHPFENNWSAMFNQVIEHAETQGYDTLVRIDPDEAIFAQDVRAIRQLLESHTILCLPRYNFWSDRLHYTPGFYPDWQVRAFRLNMGLRYSGQHHESINWLAYGMKEGDPADPTSQRDVLRVPSVHIYHYGDVGKERILERDLHYLNVAREAAGHPPLTERPADRAFPTRHNIPFCGRQPLDPAIVGATAPWSE